MMHEETARYAFAKRERSQAREREKASPSSKDLSQSLLTARDLPHDAFYIDHCIALLLAKPQLSIAY